MRSVFGVACNLCPHRVVRGIPRSAAMITPYQEGPLYELHCPAGHSAVVLLTNPKHEILFQIAAYSLLDGDYRGAVGGFTSSLEYFWHFATQCVCASQGVKPLPVPRARNAKQPFEQKWAQTFESVPPPVLKEEDCGLRNRVLHEGFIPSEEEAFAHGDKVLDLIVPAMVLLRQQLQDAVAEASAAIIEDGKKRLDKSTPTIAIQDATILLDNESMRYRRLRNYIPHLQKMDELFALLSRNGQYDETDANETA